MIASSILFATLAVVFGSAPGYGLPVCPCDWPVDQYAFLSEPLSHLSAAVAYVNHEFIASGNILMTLRTVFLPVFAVISADWEEAGVTMNPDWAAEAEDRELPLYAVIDDSQKMVEEEYKKIKQAIGSTDIQGSLLDKILDSSIDFMACAIYSVDSSLKGSQASNRAARSGTRALQPEDRTYQHSFTDYLANIEYLANVLDTTFNATTTDDCRNSVQYVEYYLQLVSGSEFASSSDNIYQRIKDYVNIIKTKSLSYDVNLSLLSAGAVLEYIVLVGSGFSGQY